MLRQTFQTVYLFGTKMLAGLPLRLPAAGQRLDQCDGSGLLVRHGLHQRAARIQCGGLRGDDFGIVDQAAAVSIEHLLLDLVGGQRCLSAQVLSSGSHFFKARLTVA